MENVMTNEEAKEKIKELLKIEKSVPETHRFPGNISVTIWKLPNGLMHRQYGPAWEVFDLKSESIIKQEFWLNGVKQSKK